MQDKKRNIIFIDSDCLLCNTFVLFLIRIDKKAILSFAPLTSPFFKENTLLDHEQLQHVDSVIFLDENRQTAIYSDAVINIFMKLGGFWRIVMVLKLIPKFIRDFIYKRIASNRRLLNTAHACPNLDSKYKERFI
jgi:predicted DCC family thiol-disulfide oxidoreductase YuxK